MKHLLLLIATLVGLSSASLAQESKVKPFEGDPGYSPGFEKEMSYLSDKFDGRVQDWYNTARRPSNDELRHMNAYGFAADEVPTYSMEVVQERLNKLNFVVPMDYNPIVKSYIDLYTVRHRKMTELLLGRAEVYFPIFEEVFDKEGVPQELKYLAIIESALNPRARSWAGATGLFQFMYGTAALYHLKMNSYVDERHDPYKSAKAAARYLRDLYKIYGDWHLVMASYNCGPGNMNRAIRRSGGKQTYWEVAPYLPAETRGYVPGFIGAAYAMEYATEHNLYPRYTDFTYKVEEIKIVRQKLSLRDLANKTGADYETLKKLNPELKIGVVPYSSSPYSLRVPHTTALAIRKAMRDGSIELNELNASYTKASMNAKSKLVFHILEKGEQLEDVAEQYRVTVNDILGWNNLWGYKVSTGATLKVYVPLQKEEFASAKKPQIKNETTRNASTATKNTTPPANNNAKYHTVRKGDTLGALAKRYGTSISRLCSLNSISRNKFLQINQRLRVQ